MRERLSDLLRLAAASLLTGGLVGVLGGSFRYLLSQADHLRDRLILQAHGSPVYGLCATLLVIGAATALARWMVVRFAPLAAGSGVQHVEAMMRGEARPAGFVIIPVKFVAGLLGIGAGLALGREGPTVQMGATVGTAVATGIVAGDPDRLVVNAAGAGAGLAVAFNAPIGGSVFVFEELTHSFTPQLVISTVGAASVAIAVMRLMLGDSQEFAPGSPADVPIAQLPLYLGLGALLGLAGAGYNQLTLWFLDAARGLRAIPSIVRAAAIGIAVGAVGWFSPVLVGGGDGLAQDMLSAISAHVATTSLFLIFLVRLLLGPLCYAAATPGGLFAPLLALGATFGIAYADVVGPWLPGAPIAPIACAVVGMAALFAAVVRAPLTGMVLTIEMTGRADLALAMLFACFGAHVMARAVGSPPIYDSLRERMLAQGQGPCPWAPSNAEPLRSPT